MPVLILVNQSSVPLNRDDAAPSCQIKAGSEFQVMIERRPSYRAAYVKVVQPAVRPKVHKIVMDPAKTHTMCPATWTGAAEVQVAWQPERAVRTRYVPVMNVESCAHNCRCDGTGHGASGTHVCTLECECVPAWGPLYKWRAVPKDTPIQCYPPFPGMPRSHGGARDMNVGWIEQWQSLPLTPELLAAKQAMKVKIEGMNEEYDMCPADVETVQVKVSE
jgi:hypothetical protein